MHRPEEEQPPEDGNSLPVSQFLEMLKAAAEGQLGVGRDVSSLQLLTSDDPNVVDAVQVSQHEPTLGGYLELQRANITYNCRVVRVEVWYDDGVKIINLTFQPEHLDLNADMGYQVQDGDVLYDDINGIPEGYRGRIEIHNDGEGKIESIRMVKEDTEDALDPGIELQHFQDGLRDQSEKIQAVIANLRGDAEIIFGNIEAGVFAYEDKFGNRQKDYDARFVLTGEKDARSSEVISEWFSIMDSLDALIIRFEVLAGLVKMVRGKNLLDEDKCDGLESELQTYFDDQKTKINFLFSRMDEILSNLLKGQRILLEGGFEMKKSALLKLLG